MLINYHTIVAMTLLLSHTKHTDSEEDTLENNSDGSTLKDQRSSPDFSSSSQGFLSISAGWEEDGDSKESSASSSTLWSRVDELPDGLKDKIVSLRNERSVSGVFEYICVCSCMCVVTVYLASENNTC